jgi:hypothetical protein
MKLELGYHPEYGLTDEIRIKAVSDARIWSVKVAAEKNRVSAISIYKWRKRVEQVA